MIEAMSRLPWYKLGGIQQQIRLIGVRQFGCIPNRAVLATHGSHSDHLCHEPLKHSQQYKLFQLRDAVGGFTTQLRFAMKRMSTPPKQELQIVGKNIKAREVRLVLHDGQHQILPLAKALAEAAKQNLDLVQVNASAKPPVCKLLDYGKFMFNKTKAKKQQASSSKADLAQNKKKDCKEVQFSIRISSGHMDMKYNNVTRFLEKQYPVRIVALDGRKHEHSLRAALLKDLQERLTQDSYVVGKEIKTLGRKASFMVEPKKA